MYAVIELGGRQWKVEPGTRLDVNRLPSEVGKTHTVERVLLAHDGKALQMGRPYVSGAQVVCEVLEHRLGPKVISYHFRRRENWRKTVGHRQPLTRLVVKDILFSEGAVGEASAKAVVHPHTTVRMGTRPRAPRMVTPTVVTTTKRLSTSKGTTRTPKTKVT